MEKVPLFPTEGEVWRTFTFHKFLICTAASVASSLTLAKECVKCEFPVWIKCLYLTASIVTKRVPKYLFTGRAAARTHLPAWFRDLERPSDRQRFAPKRTWRKRKTFLQVLDFAIRIDHKFLQGSWRPATSTCEGAARIHSFIVSFVWRTFTPYLLCAKSWLLEWQNWMRLISCLERDIFVKKEVRFSVCLWRL